jgi:hypothetical protein
VGEALGGIIFLLFVLAVLFSWLEMSHPVAMHYVGMAFGIAIILGAVGAVAFVAFLILRVAFEVGSTIYDLLSMIFRRREKPLPVPIPSSQWSYQERWEHSTKLTAPIMQSMKEYADDYRAVPDAVFSTMRSWAIGRFMEDLRFDLSIENTQRYVFIVLQRYIDLLPENLPATSYLSVPLGDLIPVAPETREPDKLYDVLVPYVIPQEFKYEGMWLPCGPGSGKTNLLHCMVNATMEEVRQKQASVFLMDSKSNDKKGLLDTWQHVDFEFQWGIENVYIFEVKDKLGINIFDFGEIDQIVNLFEYMLSDLVSFELTGYQKLMLTNCLHVIKKSDRPSIPALFDLIESGWRPYEQAIRKTRPHIQNFFIKPNPDPRNTKKLRSAFDNTQGSETRLQLATRLNALLSIDKLYDTLVSERTEVDLRHLIDEGSVIIVNAKISDLTPKGSEFWQRLWTMMLLEAGRKRESEIPLYCIFDEAHRGIARDTKIPEILSELRSANVAVTISHQGTWQIEDARVTSALSNMSAITLKETKTQGVFTATMRRSEPKTLHVEHFDLNSLPRMSRRKARAQKEKMRGFQNTAPLPQLRQIPHIKEAEAEVLYPEPASVYAEAAELEPEPFHYTGKPTVTDAEYEVIIPEPPAKPKTLPPPKRVSTTIICANAHKT